MKSRGRGLRRSYRGQALLAGDRVVAQAAWAWCRSGASRDHANPPSANPAASSASSISGIKTGASPSRVHLAHRRQPDRRTHGVEITRQGRHRPGAASFAPTSPACTGASLALNRACSSKRRAGDFSCGCGTASDSAHAATHSLTRLSSAGSAGKLSRARRIAASPSAPQGAPAHCRTQPAAPRSKRSGPGPGAGRDQKGPLAEGRRARHWRPGWPWGHCQAVITQPSCEPFSFPPCIASTKPLYWSLRRPTLHRRRSDEPTANALSAADRTGERLSRR